MYNFLLRKFNYLRFPLVLVFIKFMSLSPINFQPETLNIKYLQKLLRLHKNTVDFAIEEKQPY